MKILQKESVMPVQYEKVQLIEILTEFISGVYGKQLNKILKQDLETDDISTFDGVLLQQLKAVRSIDLFQKDMAELEQIKAYWQAMNELVSRKDF